AHHQQLRIHMLARHSEDTDAIMDALYGPEIREMNQQLLAVRRELCTASRIRSGFVGFAIYEVVDDPDIIRNGEGFNGVAAKIFADGSNPVRALDGKFRDAEIGGIAADERYIRPVKRGDEGQTAL